MPFVIFAVLVQTCRVHKKPCRIGPGLCTLLQANFFYEKAHFVKPHSRGPMGPGAPARSFLYHGALCDK
jgi:hypothetical protein